MVEIGVEVSVLVALFSTAATRAHSRNHMDWMVSTKALSCQRERELAGPPDLRFICDGTRAIE